MAKKTHRARTASSTTTAARNGNHGDAAAASGNPSEDTQSVRAASDVMTAHLDALNAGDEQALLSTLHFPHYRLNGGALKVWKTPSTYLNDFRRRAGDVWHHSKWGEMRVIAADDDKVHLDVRVDRYTENGKRYASFRSLWVVAKIDGQWAAQLRSSFAADKAGSK